MCLCMAHGLRCYARDLDAAQAAATATLDRMRGALETEVIQRSTLLARATHSEAAARTFDEITISHAVLLPWTLGAEGPREEHRVRDRDLVEGPRRRLRVRRPREQRAALDHLGLEGAAHAVQRRRRRGLRGVEVSCVTP